MVLLSFAAITTFKIIFICWGNICRSPAAHGTMNYLINKYNLTNIEVDSAATESIHVGQLPDERTRCTALERGIQVNHRSRQVTLKDLETFDLIIAMDNENYEKLQRLGNNKYNDKIKKMIDFLSKDKYGSYDEIPDPYYGGINGFYNVLDLVYDGCIGILQKYKFIQDIDN